jgi:undecaprenyl diphosphate synthase
MAVSNPPVSSVSEKCTVLNDICMDSLPQHIAIIMDGNGRWAQAQGLPRVSGHRAGVKAVRAVVAACLELRVPYLTLFGFSSENWKRPEQEVSALMGLLKIFLGQELNKLHKQGVKLNFIGDISRMAADIQAILHAAEAKTAHNTALVLTIALSYGGRDELVQAARKLAAQAVAGEISSADISEKDVDAALLTHGLPDPDLLIRTSGEVRISNFLLWQCAYSEFVFLDTLWPDFNRDTLLSAIALYQKRDRRFGGLGKG